MKIHRFVFEIRQLDVIRVALVYAIAVIPATAVNLCPVAQGTLIGGDGFPVNGATVRLYRGKDLQGTPLGITKTQLGSFSFLLTECGTYSVVPEGGKALTFNAKGATNLKVTLAAPKLTPASGEAATRGGKSSKSGEAEYRLGQLAVLRYDDIDGLRRAYVGALLGPSELRRMGAGDEAAKQVIFDTAMTLYASRVEALREASELEGVGHRILALYERMTRDREKARKDPTISNHPLMLEFSRGHTKPLDHWEPFDILQFELRASVAALDSVGTTGMEVAMAGSSEASKESSRYIFPSDAEAAEFFRRDLKPAERVHALHDQMRTFLVRQMTPEAQETWGQDATLKRMNPVAYDAMQKDKGELLRQGAVEIAFGTQGVNLYKATPGAVTPEEKHAYENRLIAGGMLVLGVSNLRWAVKMAPARLEAAPASQ